MTRGSSSQPPAADAEPPWKGDPGPTRVLPPHTTGSPPLLTVAAAPPAAAAGPAGLHAPLGPFSHPPAPKPDGAAQGEIPPRGAAAGSCPARPGPARPGPPPHLPQRPRHGRAARAPPRRSTTHRPQRRPRGACAGAGSRTRRRTRGRACATAASAPGPGG